MDPNAPTTAEIWRDGLKSRVVAVDEHGIRQEQIVEHRSETEFARYVDETEAAFKGLGLVRAPSSHEPGLIARWRRSNLN